MLNPGTHKFGTMKIEVVPMADVPKRGFRFRYTLGKDVLTLKGGEYLDLNKEGHLPFATLGRQVKPQGPSWINNLVLCPLCHGYGGWVLLPHEYGQGRHFECFCDQCSGWGWVEAKSTDATCVHEWGNRKNLGRCYNEYTCLKCGQKREVDSSD